MGKLMGVCVETCYFKKRYTIAGEKAVFNSEKELKENKNFKFFGNIEDEEPKKKKPFSQLTVDEYLELAKQKDIEVPEEIAGKRENLKNFLKAKGADE